MGYFESLKETQTCSLDRPCKYTGETILLKAQETLHELIDKELKNTITEEERQQKQWLSRITAVIRRDNYYECSIDEAVKIGILA